LIHAAIWPQQIWAENWGLCPFGAGELGPSLTQCGQGRGLSACQFSSWSAQPFGHNTRTSQTGHDRQTDRVTVRPMLSARCLSYLRQDRQRSDSIGRTVLQTVAPKRGWLQNIAVWLLSSRTLEDVLGCITGLRRCGLLLQMEYSLVCRSVTIVIPAKTVVAIEMDAACDAGLGPAV